MADPPYELVFYEDGNGKKPCLEWIRDDLSPVKRRAAGFAMSEVLQEQGVGVCDDESWGKPVGGGVFEFRIMRVVKWTVTQKGKRVQKSERISLRIFCHAYGNKKILVLHGYDKRSHPGAARQQAEIGRAKRRLRAWREQKRQKAKKRTT